MSITDFSHAGEQTKAIHAGEIPDPFTRASAPNLVMSTTFVVDADTGFSVEGFEDNDTWIYTRWGNPTIHQLELKLAALEQSGTAMLLPVEWVPLPHCCFIYLKQATTL